MPSAELCVSETAKGASSAGNSVSGAATVWSDVGKTIVGVADTLSCARIQFSGTVFDCFEGQIRPVEAANSIILKIYFRVCDQ